MITTIAILLIKNINRISLRLCNSSSPSMALTDLIISSADNESSEENIKTSITEMYIIIHFL
jgi:hypothetical protein